MTTPGTGGLPPRRPDQMRTYAPPTQAPGTAAGVVRARLVIISGTSAGVFDYSGTPGLGTLVASLVGNTTVDPFGNTVNPDGLTIYNGAESAFFGTKTVSATPEIVLEFLTGASFEGTPNGGLMINYAVEGAGPAAFLSAGILGPFTNVTGHGDSVAIALNSANEGGTSSANGGLDYTDTGGGFHQWAFWDSTGFNITTGTVNGITPGTGTLTGAVTAGAPPSGAGGASASTLGGAALSYFDALETDFNDNAAALNDVVNLLLGWGV
jgi:hypothetical protein